jgi:altronate dehydratase small subunit
LNEDNAIALIINEKDNVAVIFDAISAGEKIRTIHHSGEQENYSIVNDIPYGHKFAIRPIQKGELIIKYGENIGVASNDINVGEHVHVHNLESLRARGDWK